MTSSDDVRRKVIVVHAHLIGLAGEVMKRGRLLGFGCGE
jgi:hypothetical protein